MGDAAKPDHGDAQSPHASPLPRLPWSFPAGRPYSSRITHSTHDRSAAVAEANRRFYAAVADEYERTEDCVVSVRHRQRLRSQLKAAVMRLPDRPRVLDACGGSGNASLILHELGITPVTVDVSREMLSIYEAKAAARGLVTETHVDEIEAFLSRRGTDWHLIIFSSALHHLENYERIIDLAVDCLVPGGILVTAFDPIATDFLGRRLRRVEYVFHVLLRSPKRVPRLLFRRISTPANTRVTDGVLAERWALEGLDDLALAERFQRRGLDILAHDRICEARFGVTRMIYRLLDRPTTFHFIVRRKDSDAR